MNSMMKLGAKHFAKHHANKEMATIKKMLRINPYEEDGFVNLFLKGYRRAYHQNQRKERNADIKKRLVESAAASKNRS